MNITRTDNELTAVLKIQIGKADYEPKVDSACREYGKKAKIPGFRPGKVPMSMLRKLVGKHAMVEEINKLVTESLYKYIDDEKIEIVGEPIPSEKEQKQIDFDNDTEFEFAFELGLAPKIELELNDKISLPYYNVEVSDKMVEEQIDYYTRRFGAHAKSEFATKASSMYGKIEQVDAEGNVLEGGISKEAVRIAIDVIKDEEIQNKFIGANKQQIITFDIKKAFENEVEISSMLGIKKEEVADLVPNFQYAIEEISDFANAEVNQELFDKVFGVDTVASVEEFRSRVVENLKEQLSGLSDNRFAIDAKKQLLDELNLPLPADFLKNWLLFRDNEKKITPEIMEKEYPLVEADFRWQLVKKHIIANSEIKISEEEILDFAREELMKQVVQYGLPLENLPEGFIDNSVMERLKKKEEVNRIVDLISDQKVFENIRANVTLDRKNISLEDFNQLYSK